MTAALAAFVVLCTAWALMVPAITITDDNAQPEAGFFNGGNGLVAGVAPDLGAGAALPLAAGDPDPDPVGDPGDPEDDPDPADPEDDRIYAIQITKIVVDENGNRIRFADAQPSTFHIYVNPEGSADSVKDLNVGSATGTPDYVGYAYVRDMQVPIGEDGLGTLYDHDVSPGLYYIAEDPESIQGQITDTSGQQWNYKQTYFLTEYAWRNHPNDNYMHVSETSSGTQGDYASVPEYLGDHPSYDGTETFTNNYLEFYAYNVYEAPKVDVPVNKTWPDFDNVDAYDWEATFRLQWAPIYPGETSTSGSFQNVEPIREITVSKSQMAGETAQAASLAARTFADLPMYGTDSSGDTFRYQYSLQEVSYRVTDASTGSVVYSWDEINGYNTTDEDTHYQAFYPHDAGEESADASDYYIRVRNAKKNVREKETVDVALDKQWDSTFSPRDDSYYAEFELRRFAHTEYRDLSHMTDEDRAADPVMVTILDGNGAVVDALEVQPNVGVYLAGNFAGHDSTKTVTFTTDGEVELADGSTTSTVTATAEGANMSNALVRSQEFFVTQDTVFTITAGEENLVDTGKIARVRDTSSGTNPLPDRSFSQTIRLDSTNNWHVDLTGLVHSVTSSGDDDDDENVTYYEYYFEEIESSPKGYAQYYLNDGSGGPSTTLYGDSDHQIETDAAIVAVNGPANRLIVKKNWRGVADATGFPHVTFTLYQGWASGDGTVSPNGGDSWVYENDHGESYQNVELPSSSLTWICPEVLPETKLDSNGTSRQVGYYVEETVRSGSQSEGNITTSWQFYYYRNSNGKQTNAGHQGYFAGLTGASLAQDGGTITICNKLNDYTQLDIQKQFFELGSAGSWGNVTSPNSRWANTILGFKVIRAIRAADGTWIDERGNASDTPVWMDFSDEMLCGYNGDGHPVVGRGPYDIFWLRDAGGDWHFRIEDNQGDQTDATAGGSGLPKRGFYIENGRDIPVEYWYSFRETGVYRFASQDADGTIHVADAAPDWDWYSSITPVNAYGPESEMEAFPKVHDDQDPKRIANFQASDLLVHKQWIGNADASEVYVKIWRTTDGGTVEDFTEIIAQDVRDNHNWQMYLEDESEIDVDHAWLILKDDGSGEWTDALKVNRALLGPLAETGRYRYYIQEVGYKTRQGQVHTNPDAKYNPQYDHMVDGEWTGAPVGADEYASNFVTIGGKGENQLKVINSTAPSTSYRVNKVFSGTHSASGGQSSVTDRYPTDGSAQATIQLQQRYRFEKTEGGVDYVSDDNVNWVRADSADAATTWTVDWQAAESAHPSSVTLPLPKPEGSTLSDTAWYGSASAWSYTWENLDLVKVISNAGDPENEVVAQLYYRAVETDAPEWMTPYIAEDEANGHKAVDDNGQSIAQILSEKNSVTNIQGQCDLRLNKEWTGLPGDDSWPDGYVVSYQLIQSFHLAGPDSYGPAFKSVEMARPQQGEAVSDSVHPQATGTLEESNHNLNITGLPQYGFYTATAADVEAAAEAGVTLTPGVVYPVVYTYSAKETAVKKNGVDVDFRAQTVDAERDETVADGVVYEATLSNDVTGITVRKEWDGLTPGANESATIGLFRFEKEREPEPETTFAYTVSVAGNAGALASGGSVFATVYDEDDETVGTCELNAVNGWSHVFMLEIGKTYHAEFTGDGSVLNASVSPGSDSGITEARSVEVNATVKPVASGSVKVIVTGSPSGLWFGELAQYVNGQQQAGTQQSWGASYFDGSGGETTALTGLMPGQEYRFSIGAAPSSYEGATVTGTTVSFIAVDGLTTITLNYDGGSGGGNTTTGRVEFDGVDGSYWGVNEWNSLEVGTPYEVTIQVNYDPEQCSIVASGVSAYSIPYTNSWGSGGQIVVNFTPASADEVVVITVTRTQGARGARMLATGAGMQVKGAASPLRAPAVEWVNDTSGLPEGADPDNDTLVEQVVFSGTNWSKNWDDLPKYSSEGNEYVYYAYELDYSGAAGATEMETTYTTVDENGLIVVTNTPTVPDQHFDLNILKVEKDAASKTLDGAVFELNKLVYDPETGAISYEDGSFETAVTADGGQAAFSGLTPGSYYEVKETSLPDGYVLIGDGAFYIKVTISGIDLVVREEGEAPDQWQVVESTGPVTLSVESGAYTATVENEPGTPLPHTGGPGSTPFVAAGLVLVLLAGALRRWSRNRA